MTDLFLLNIDNVIYPKLDKTKFQEIFGQDADCIYRFYKDRVSGNIHGLYTNLPYIEGGKFQGKGYQEIFAGCVGTLIKDYFREHGYQITKIVDSTAPVPPTPPPVSQRKTSPGSRIVNKQSK